MGMGPQRAATPRTGLEDFISNLFVNSLQQIGANGAPASASRGGGKIPIHGPGSGAGSQAPGGMTIQDLFQSLSIPQYGGPMTAPQTPLQRGAVAAAGGGLAQLPAYEQLGGSIVNALGSVPGAPMGPASAINLLTNRPGEEMLRGLGGPNGAISQLLSAGSSGGDFAGILDAMNNARKQSLGNDLRDIQERFSASGLRNSTDLASSLGQASNQSEANWLSQAAQLIPQITSARTGALTAAGQLGLGAGSTLQQGGLQAADILGQLFQGQQGRGLSALQSLPGVAELFAGLPNQVASGAYNIGAASQAADTQGLQALYNEFLRTQGGLLPPILNFAAGAPQITGPGKGSQLLGAGTTIGAAAL